MKTLGELLIGFALGCAPFLLIRILLVKFYTAVVAGSKKISSSVNPVIGWMIEMLALFFLAVLPVEILLILPLFWLTDNLVKPSVFLAVGFFIGIVIALITLYGRENSKN